MKASPSTVKMSTLLFHHKEPWVKTLGNLRKQEYFYVIKLHDHWKLLLNWLLSARLYLFLLIM